MSRIVAGEADDDDEEEGVDLMDPSHHDTAQPVSASADSAPPLGQPTAAMIPPLNFTAFSSPPPAPAPSPPPPSPPLPVAATSQPPLPKRSTRAPPSATGQRPVPPLQQPPPPRTTETDGEEIVAATVAANRKKAVSVSGSRSTQRRNVIVVNDSSPAHSAVRETAETSGTEAAATSAEDTQPATPPTASPSPDRPAAPDTSTTASTRPPVPHGRPPLIPPRSRASSSLSTTRPAAKVYDAFGEEIVSSALDDGNGSSATTSARANTSARGGNSAGSPPSAIPQEYQSAVNVDHASVAQVWRATAAMTTEELAVMSTSPHNGGGGTARDHASAASKISDIQKRLRSSAASVMDRIKHKMTDGGTEFTDSGASTPRGLGTPRLEGGGDGPAAPGADVSGGSTAVAPPTGADAFVSKLKDVFNRARSGSGARRTDLPTADPGTASGPVSAVDALHRFISGAAGPSTTQFDFVKHFRPAPYVDHYTVSGHQRDIDDRLRGEAIAAFLRVEVTDRPVPTPEDNLTAGTGAERAVAAPVVTQPVSGRLPSTAAPIHPLFLALQDIKRSAVVSAVRTAGKLTHARCNGVELGVHHIMQCRRTLATFSTNAALFEAALQEASDSFPRLVPPRPPQAPPSSR